MIDLAIIGSGPAGMAAALAASHHGLQVLVIDDRPDPGGQIFRQPPNSYSVADWLTHRVYRPLHHLCDQFTQAGQRLERRSRTTVLGLAPTDAGWELSLMTPDGLEVCSASRVLIASGCFDMPVTFDGAQMPGVMATGGLQAFIKSQQIVPGERFYFIGTHPLQLLVADQLRKAGADIAGVAFEQPLSQFLAVTRHALTLSRQLPNVSLLFQSLFGLMKSGVSIRFGRELIAAAGTERLEHVLVATPDRDKTPQAIDCDRLGLCYGFLTNNDLVRLAGADCTWSWKRGGWIATHDEDMRSSQPGLYVAGEATGVDGANVARLEGQLAGLGAALDAGTLAQEAYCRLTGQLRKELENHRRFARLLADIAYPGNRLSRLMSETAYLCKCEELTVDTVRKALDTHGDIQDLSALKLMTRCGMGHCQGRYCHYQARWLMAEERDRDESTLGGFTARFPIKPVRLGDLTKTPGD
ncbi:BFD domain protein (2Fe-2S)-binding domain protein [Luminiphilus syltensis NOR5-1B]|uniref:BFD domain protein (2Fe-2S)-binding domain protein n=1 Tax=Luminiphilus syltensis NOR5-1B TaxID=565045 RepID=B8KS51_9GAMM|nr:NAD(P)/FAD-dependent oxidoreductase [Luminiphilus syltensis]EED34776.1 BFD domain protein (2Fe-2S)-binding domain protein [Luminiphilus syltensis NOR5-1B]